jgi:hypothetical protein
VSLSTWRKTDSTKPIQFIVMEIGKWKNHQQLCTQEGWLKGFCRVICRFWTCLLWPELPIDCLVDEKLPFGPP